MCDAATIPLMVSVMVRCVGIVDSSLNNHIEISPSQSGITWYNLDSVQIGLLTSGSLYGALIGFVLAFNIADFLGRRRELIVAALLYLVGALITALAPTFLVLVAGRLVFGIGIGLVCSFLCEWFS
ncbi:hypothetical protein KIW84_032833 [Lathyrus oleraceus]|uniref:Major facilitator superfamily (MFS) profile domain-containing protein n=1 Tax=Pisum sativum TaxID=3888 RepID=A0A9D4XWE5_PEA|nr:hypothetical protein KIW84_032833 [Pisum sativum]